ncbi:MAG: hypothetical protein GYA50_01390 [Eubacteriaceae bacterium]|nr:hypothetical protein [Eubacteriaceae bacterium]
MSEPDLGNSFFLLILFYLASIFFIEHKKLKNKLLTDYINKLNITKATCALYCKFLFGIEKLNENTVCCLCADDKSLKITSDNIIIKTIKLSDILNFEECELNNAIQKMMLAGAYIPIDHRPFSKIIVIDYISEINEIKELFFSLELDKRQLKSNKFFLSKCNIFNFINQRLEITET